MNPAQYLEDENTMMEEEGADASDIHDVSFESNDSTLVDVSQTKGIFIQLNCNHSVTESKDFLLQLNIDVQLIQVIKKQSISDFHYSLLVKQGFVIGISSQKMGFLQPDSKLLLWCSFCQTTHKLDQFRAKSVSGQQITLYNTCWARVSHGENYNPIHNPVNNPVNNKKVIFTPNILPRMIPNCTPPFWCCIGFEGDFFLELN